VERERSGSKSQSPERERSGERAKYYAKICSTIKPLKVNSSKSILKVTTKLSV